MALDAFNKLTGTQTLIPCRLFQLFTLQRHQNPNHHEQYLPNGIQQVFAELIISPDSYREEALANLAEEAEHWNIELWV